MFIVAKPLDIAGERHGRIVAIKSVGRNKQGRLWECKCDCGKTKIINASEFRTGKILSCGCYNSEIHTTHGLSRNPIIAKIFDRYHMIKERTTNPNCSRYKDYGGRGIRLWSAWEQIPSLFVAHILNLGWNPKLTIDRINNEKGYEPGNIRLVSYAAQNRNKRSNFHVTLYGKQMVLTDAAKELGLNYAQLQYWVRKLGFEKAVQRMNHCQ